MDNVDIIREKIKRQLGYPMVNLEISDDMIDTAIMYNIQEYDKNMLNVVSLQSLDDVKETLYHVRKKFVDIDLVSSSKLNTEFYTKEK